MSVTFDTASCFLSCILRCSSFEFLLLICTCRNCQYLPASGRPIYFAKLLRLFPTAQNLPKNPLRFYISLEIGPIEYEKRTNNHTIKYWWTWRKGKKKGEAMPLPKADTLYNKVSIWTVCRCYCHTTFNCGVIFGFNVIRLTLSRLLSSAMFAYICVVETFLCPNMCWTV